MASLIKTRRRGKTTYRISFFHPSGDRRRKTIWLGKLAKAAAREYEVLVEQLVEAWSPDSTPPPRLAGALRALKPKFHKKFVQVELAQPAVAPTTLGDLIAKFRKTQPVKPSTLETYQQGLSSLSLYFGDRRLVLSITHEDALNWRRSIESEPISVATQGKRTRTAKTLFNKAIAWKVISENPFRGVKEGSQVNTSRIKFVERNTVETALRHCDDPRLRALIALARFAGLRVPSEPARLRWADFSPCGTSLRVYAEKTQKSRTVPICSELRTALEELRHASNASQPQMFPKLESNTNLRTALQRVLTRANLEQWPKLWQNLRASCANDWARTFGAAAESEWSGHSVQIAVEHYLRPSQEDFLRAAGMVA